MITPKNHVLTVAPQALKALQAMLKQNSKSYLRIGLKRKGCAALSYMMCFVETPCTTDVPVEVNENMRIFIQSNALMFLIGLTMDYVEEGTRSGFVFRNPKEKGRCGCGSSFYI